MRLRMPVLVRIIIYACVCGRTKVYEWIQLKVFHFCSRANALRHCLLRSGYIKSWLTSVLARPADDDELSDADTTISCLVALAVPVEMSVTAESDNGGGGIEVDVASSSSDPSSPVGALVSTTFEFFSRHTADGKFTFVDHRPAPSLIDGVLYSA